MEEFIRNKLIKIRSKRTVNEFRTFVWNNGRPQAMRSYNDVKVPGQDGYNHKADLQKKKIEAKKQYEDFSWVYKG